MPYPTTELHTQTKALGIMYIRHGLGICPVAGGEAVEEDIGW